MNSLNPYHMTQCVCLVAHIIWYTVTSLCVTRILRGKYCIFTKSNSDFTVVQHYSAPLTYSWLNSAPVLYPLLLFKLHFFFHLSFYLFSVLSCHLCSVHHFDHLLFYSLIICIAFHYSLSLHVNILCMWFLCALLHPPLPFPYHSLWYSLHFIVLLSPLLWLLCICLTLYIISWSPVLVL